MSLECCCCFDDQLTETQVGRCNGNHVTCNACINYGVINAVGEMRIFACPDASRCLQIISERTIDMCITDVGLKRAYSNICTSNALRNIHGLTQCAFCEYAVILDDNDLQFHCVVCEKIYCKSCKQDVHLGACLTDIDRETERQITAISIRCCSYPPIIKIDACNHVTCLCGTAWCWYCKGTRGVQRENVHMCAGGCDLYRNPRAVTIDVTATQVNANTQNEQVRIAAQQQATANANTRRIEQERLRIAQARTQREQLQRDELRREQLREREREEQERRERERERERRVQLQREQEQLQRAQEQERAEQLRQELHRQELHRAQIQREQEQRLKQEQDIVIQARIDKSARRNEKMYNALLLKQSEKIRRRNEKMTRMQIITNLN